MGRDYYRQIVFFCNPVQHINKLEQGQYNDRGINVVREFKDRGIRVWGARTLATKSDPSWKYINVRRLFIMIEQSIMIGSQWSVFDDCDSFIYHPSVLCWNG